MTNIYRLNLVTAPATEPVTLTEVKDQLRIDGSDEDTYLTNLITAGRIACEEYTRRAFINQTWQAFYDYIPFMRYINGCDLSDNIDAYGTSRFYKNRNQRSSFTLPKSPLVSVTHIKTYADDDTETIFSTDNYQVSVYDGTNPQEGRITLRDGATFPDFTRNADGVEVQFIAGYGTSASDVPMMIRQAILAYIAHLYNNRGDCEKMQIPVTAKMMLKPFRLMRL